MPEAADPNYQQPIQPVAPPMSPSRTPLEAFHATAGFLRKVSIWAHVFGWLVIAGAVLASLAILANDELEDQEPFAMFVGIAGVGQGVLILTFASLALLVTRWKEANDAREES